MKGTLLSLRKPEVTDLPLMTAWLQEPDFSDYLFKVPENQHEATALSLLTQNAKDSSTQLTLLAETKANTAIGLLFYKNINWKHRHAELNTLIGDPKNRGLLYGAELYLLGLGYAFFILNLHKVFGYTYATNTAAVKLNRILATPSGVLKKHTYHRGTYVDTYIFSMTRNQFMTLIKNPSTSMMCKFIETGMFDRFI